MKERIILLPGVSEQLKVKVIDKIAYNYSLDELEDNRLIITFTDNSYIYLSIINDEDYYGNSDISLANIKPKEVDVNTNIYGSGNDLTLPNIVQHQIDTGIIAKPSIEKLQNILKKREEKHRENKYREYLKLKEMFEPSNK